MVIRSGTMLEFHLKRSKLVITGIGWIVTEKNGSALGDRFWIGKTERDHVPGDEESSVY